MRRILPAAGLLILVWGCSGSTANDVEGDLPEDFDDSASALVAEPEPNDDGTADDGDHRDGDKGDRDDDNDDHDGDRKHKKKHRHHHLFKKLDRLDGDKDGQITIASLPARVPTRVIDKLHEIDTNKDGLVTRAESHDYCKAKHHDWKH